MEEEIKVDLKDLTNRRRHWDEALKDLSELASKWLVENSPMAKIKDDEEVSSWAFAFSDWPRTKQDAHWQLQSYLMMEMLQVLREIRDSLKNNGKESPKKLVRRLKENEAKG